MAFSTPSNSLTQSSQSSNEDGGISDNVSTVISLCTRGSRLGCAIYRTTDCVIDVFELTMLYNVCYVRESDKVAGSSDWRSNYTSCNSRDEASFVNFSSQAGNEHPANHEHSALSEVDVPACMLWLARFIDVHQPLILLPDDSYSCFSSKPGTGLSSYHSGAASARNRKQACHDDVIARVLRLHDRHGHILRLSRARAFDSQEALPRLSCMYPNIPASTLACRFHLQHVAMLSAMAALLYYTDSVQSNIANVVERGPVSALYVDPSTLSALQVTRLERHPCDYQGRGKSKEGLSLFSVVNYTTNPAGKALLRQWLVLPSSDVDELTRRQAVVSFFVQPARQELLKRVRVALHAVRPCSHIFSLLRSGKARLGHYQTLLRTLCGMDAVVQMLSRLLPSSVSLLQTVVECCLVHELRRMAQLLVHTVYGVCRGVSLGATVGMMHAMSGDEEGVMDWLPDAGSSYASVISTNRGGNRECDPNPYCNSSGRRHIDLRRGGVAKSSLITIHQGADPTGVLDELRVSLLDLGTTLRLKAEEAFAELSAPMRATLCLRCIFISPHGYLLSTDEACLLLTGRACIPQYNVEENAKNDAIHCYTNLLSKDGARAMKNSAGECRMSGAQMGHEGMPLCHMSNHANSSINTQIYSVRGACVNDDMPGQTATPTALEVDRCAAAAARNDSNNTVVDSDMCVAPGIPTNSNESTSSLSSSSSSTGFSSSCCSATTREHEQVTAVPAEQHDGEVLIHAVLSHLQCRHGWELHYTDHDTYFFKTERMRELDKVVGDLRERVQIREDELRREMNECLLYSSLAVLSPVRVFAELDCLLGFAYCAVRHGWTRPTLQRGTLAELRIDHGWHPILGSVAFTAPDARSMHNHSAPTGDHRYNGGNATNSNDHSTCSLHRNDDNNSSYTGDCRNHTTRDSVNYTDHLSSNRPHSCLPKEKGAFPAWSRMSMCHLQTFSLVLGAPHISRVHVFYGANGSGKSVLLGAVAHILLLAHMGSFVPAAAVSLSLFGSMWAVTPAHVVLSRQQQHNNNNPLNSSVTATVGPSGVLRLCSSSGTSSFQAECAVLNRALRCCIANAAAAETLLQDACMNEQSATRCAAASRVVHSAENDSRQCSSNTFDRDPTDAAGQQQSDSNGVDCEDVADDAAAAADVLDFATSSILSQKARSLTRNSRDYSVESIVQSLPPATLDSLRGCTSVILLDEFGCGTAPEDGRALLESILRFFARESFVWDEDGGNEDEYKQEEESAESDEIVDSAHACSGRYTHMREANHGGRSHELHGNPDARDMRDPRYSQQRREHHDVEEQTQSRERKRVAHCGRVSPTTWQLVRPLVLCATHFIEMFAYVDRGLPGGETLCTTQHRERNGGSSNGECEEKMSDMIQRISFYEMRCVPVYTSSCKPCPYAEGVNHTRTGRPESIDDPARTGNAEAGCDDGQLVLMDIIPSFEPCPIRLRHGSRSCDSDDGAGSDGRGAAQVDFTVFQDQFIDAGLALGRRCHLQQELMHIWHRTLHIIRRT